MPNFIEPTFSFSFPVWISFGSFAIFSGAALILEIEPEASPDRVLKLLQDNADKKAVGLKITNTSIYGYGKADAIFIIEEFGLGGISVPDWVKNNAGWWAERLISDDDFASGIQYMIKEGIIQVPTTSGGTEQADGVDIPDWVRNNAGWWSADLISVEDFVAALQYLIGAGIISV